MSLYRNQFRLDVRIEGQSPMKIDVIDSVSVGIDPRCDLVLSGRKIKTRHMEFLKKEENLALIYLGPTNQTFLNSLPLEEGKTYLLEPGDRIQLSGLEIIIRLEALHVHETQKVKTIIFNSSDDLALKEDPENDNESYKEGLIFRPNPAPPMKQAPQIKGPFLKGFEPGNFLALILTKAYSLLADFFFTYLILIVLMPIAHIHQPMLSVFNYMASLATVIDPNFKMHSFLPFFIAWYLLSLAQTLLFGTTIGQFFLGLKMKSENKFGKLFLYRLKTFIYSLFLIPAQNTVSDRVFFKAIRKAGMIVVFLFILISAFLLPSPYNPSFTITEEGQNSHKELRTQSLYSESRVLGIKLNAELSSRYYLLPYAELENKSARAFQFFDLKSSQSLIIREIRSISYDEIEEQLMYANPFYSTLHSKRMLDLTLKEKKDFIQKIFMSSPESLKNSLITFGPFYGSSVLLKTYLTSAETTDMTVNFYRPEMPIISVSGNAGNFYYLFSRDSLKVYSSNKKGDKALLPAFEEQVFSKFLSEDDESVVLHKQNVSILAAQDAFLQGDEHTFLTYYVGVANNLANVQRTSHGDEFTEKARLALLSNIESILKLVTNRNVQQSLTDIKNQLTPMEKPGVKR